MTRRAVIAGAGGSAAGFGQTVFAGAGLPAGIRSRMVNSGNGLTMHVLEAGFAGSEGKPCLLLLHGFPELAYSWRKLLLPLAEAGYHVVAPDQRGYGRTTGWDPDFEGDLGSFRMLNLVRDALGLVYALGHQSVEAVVGHDFGSPVAAWCSVIRPDVFRSVALMSAPFAGPPEIVFSAPQKDPIHERLAALARPRKHYQWYYSTREANDNMLRCPQGLDAFLRAYYHHKSADWAGNRPFPLQGWTASELAKLPTYYVMDRDKGMAETVAPEMPPPEVVARCRWLTDEELRVYSGEYARTGFQGGLQWYRCGTDARFSNEMAVFAKKTIDVPACFIAGAQDWGVYQKPGAVEKMRTTACKRMLGFDLIPGAGHWVQQEQPEAVTRLLLRFLKSAKA